MKTRLLSSLVMLPLLIIVYLGGLFLTIFCGLVFLYAMYEMVSALKKSGKLNVLLVVCGAIYIGLGLYSFIHVEIYSSKLLVWLILLISFGTDIFAYLSGTLIGRHKLCPKISPKKTVEGAIGAMLLTTGITLLYWYIFVIKNVLLINLYMPVIFFPSLMTMVIIGCLGSIVAMAGDLLMSFAKRQIGIKDFSSLIPGHGGVLDRIDSVLLVSIFIMGVSVLI